MKPLKSLNNMEKGKLLHDLFPDEIPQLLDNIKEFCREFKANKEAYSSDWNSGLMTFDMWLSLAEKAEATITKHSANMIKSSKSFSEQLFHSFDYTFLFVIDRIVKYSNDQHENGKFRKVVDLIFNP